MYFSEKLRIGAEKYGIISDSNKIFSYVAGLIIIMMSA